MLRIVRRARKNINSKFSHVIVQGIDKQYIFQKEIHKRKYLNLIKSNLEKFGIKLIAYTIMSNHTHMCLYYENVEMLSKYMHKINSEFAKYYNHFEKRTGYLFRNRFYSQEILDRQQLYNVIAYIHNNPKKAKIIKNLEEYTYSSYKDYITNNIDDEIILLVFQSLEFKEIFNFIHKNFKEMNIKILEEKNKDNYKSIIKLFLEKNKVSLSQVTKDNEILVELLKELKIESNMTNKAISKALNLDKNRVTRLMKKIQNN